MTPMLLANLFLGPFGWPPSVTVGEGAALAAATAVFLILAFRLPSRWPSLRAPSVLGGLYLTAFVLRALETDSGLAGVLSPISLFLLTAWIGHLALLAAAERARRRARGPAPARLFRLLLVPVYLLAVLVALESAGVLTTELLLGLALTAGVVLWVGNDLVRDATAGIVLRAEGGLAAGEGLGLADGTVGRILKVGWRATVVLAPDGVEVVVPNRRLLEQEVRRLTRDKKSVWRSVTVACPAETPPGQAEAVILGALRDCGEVEQEPAPSVLVRDVSGHGVEYCARFLPRDEEAGERADSEVRIRLWYALDRAGIPLVPAGASATPAGTTGRAARLRRVDLFAGLPDELLSALAAAAQLLRYGRGETIFHQGDPGNDLYLIDSGAVLILTRDADGAEREVARLEAGQYFGEMALLTGEHRSATVRAVREAELIVLTKDAFGSVLQKAPELAQSLRRVLEVRQADLTRINQRLAGERGESLVDRFSRRFQLSW